MKENAEPRAPMLRALLVVLAASAAIFAYDRTREEPPPQAVPAASNEPAPLTPRPRLPASARSEPTDRITREIHQTATQPAAVQPTAVQPAAPTQNRPAQPAASPPPDPPSTQPATYSYDWHEGAAGLERALDEAKAEGRALAVYFYTDWCGYCRQLERELLDRAVVENHMKYMTKVRINPESGAMERYVADRYGVSGYPAFFVHPGIDRAPTKVGGMKKIDGEWRIKTPEEFVEAIRRAAGSAG